MKKETKNLFENNKIFILEFKILINKGHYPKTLKFRKVLVFLEDIKSSLETKFRADQKYLSELKHKIESVDKILVEVSFNSSFKLN